MSNPMATVEKLADDLDGDFQQHERLLERYVKRLEQVSLEIDYKLRRARTALGAMRGEGVPDAPGEAKINRMSRREAEKRRAEAGEAIHKLMSDKPKGTEFSYGELQEAFPAEMFFAFPKIIDQWNALHPKQQVKHNGKPKAARRYHL